MKKILVEVTQEDIAKGCPRWATWCPIALALMRATNDDTATAGYRTMWIKSERYITPPAAQKFISKFDKWEKVEPFSFELELLRDDE